MSLIVSLAAALATFPAVPIKMKGQDARLNAGNPCRLDIAKSAASETVTIYGVDMPDKWDETVAGEEVGDGSTQNFTFDSIPYAAHSNYNTIVLVNGAIQTETTDYAVANSSGDTQIQFVSAPADGAKIEVFRVSPTSVKASAARSVMEQVRAYDFMWATKSATTEVATVAVSVLP